MACTLQVDVVKALLHESIIDCGNRCGILVPSGTVAGLEEI
jgi:hypothetical protein